MTQLEIIDFMCQPSQVQLNSNSGEQSGINQEPQADRRMGKRAATFLLLIKTYMYSEISTRVSLFRELNTGLGGGGLGNRHESQSEPHQGQKSVLKGK